MTKQIRDKIWRFVVRPRNTVFGVALLILAVGAVTAQVTVHAHFNNMKWISTTPEIRDTTSSYGSAITSAIQDYNGNTDATIYMCSTSNCENWIHIQGDYGDSGWYARNFRTYIKKTPPPHDIIESETQWNEYYTSGNDDHVARHEIGHGLGFNHTPCSINSVMQGACSPPWPSTLQAHDISDVNAEY